MVITAFAGARLYVAEQHMKQMQLTIEQLQGTVGSVQDTLEVVKKEVDDYTPWVHELYNSANRLRPIMHPDAYPRDQEKYVILNAIATW